MRYRYIEAFVPTVTLTLITCALIQIPLTQWLTISTF